MIYTGKYKEMVEQFRKDGADEYQIEKFIREEMERNEELISRLLESPCWIVDILPERVPDNATGQYFSVERYFRQSMRMNELYRRFAEIILRLNCYYDMDVSFDLGESWENNPEPEGFVEKVKTLSSNAFLRVLFASQETMMDLDAGDTYIVVYDPDPKLLDKLQKLAKSEGLFVWREES